MTRANVSFKAHKIGKVSYDTEWYSKIAPKNESGAFIEFDNM